MEIRSDTYWTKVYSSFTLRLQVRDLQENVRAKDLEIAVLKALLVQKHRAQSNHPINPEPSTEYPEVVSIH